MSHLFTSGGQSIGVSASTSVLPMNTFIFFSLFIILFYFNNYYLFIYLFYFTILYWFCHASTCIHHGCTCVPHPEPPSQGTGWISLSSKGLSRVFFNTTVQKHQHMYTCDGFILTFGKTNTIM